MPARDPSPKFNPDHPLLVGFSMLDATVSRLGGVSAATELVAVHVRAMLETARIQARCHVWEPKKARVLFSIPFPIIAKPRPRDANIGIRIMADKRHAGRHQWSVHFTSAPKYAALALEDRATLNNLFDDVCKVLVESDEIEDVEIARAL